VACPRILITETLDPVAADWLAAHAEIVWCHHAEPDFAARLADADALIVRTYTQVNDALLDKASRLKVVGRAGVGLDNIDVAACRKRGIEVVYTPDANTVAVVDYVLGLLLDYLRPRTDLPPVASAERFHQLRKTEVGRQLDEFTLGILGFGRVGKRLGRVANALGMQVLACDLLPEHEVRAAVDYPFTFVDHDTLYRDSDILSIHVDGRASNRHLVNAKVLNLVKDDVVLLNTSRGMVIDAPAMAEWAKRRAGARVMLDVHDPEPPPPDYPLWNLPNVRLLPHLASRTDRALLNMSWVVRDVWEVLQGRTPQYPAP
jgi:phosphoglycerate dehydrogenase-like enzyme